MKINGREIGPGQPPYIIAEIGGNHCDDYDKAVLLMGIAMGCGADAVKFQCFTPDSITIDCDRSDFIVKDGPWKGRKLYELYQKTHTPREWFPSLFEIARRYSQTMFASVFSPEDVNFLETCACPAYKIASMEIVDLGLIRHAAKTGKPLIISTGMADNDDIFNANEALRPRFDNHAFLHCVSGYPTPPEEANLWRMKDWMKTFCGYPPFGISDHATGIEIPVAATAMNASIIEKHLCYSHDDPSEDAAFSLDMDEFRAMCKAVKATWAAMQPSEAKSEESSRQLRRSLYVTASMRRGEVFTSDNLRSIRPSYGLAPKYLPEILGKAAKRDIERGTALTWGMVES